MTQTEQQNVPSLRFPEFKRGWEAVRFENCFVSRRQRGEAGLPIYSVTLDRGLVPRNSLERHLAADAADESNLRAEPDDAVYNMMRMWQGAVGIADLTCMVSPAYVVMKPKSDTCSSFYDQWFKRHRSLHLLWAYSHGLTNDRLRLYPHDFARIPHQRPTHSEQRKIAEFLGAVDERIAQLEQKESLLSDYKKGCMQQLFSQSIRFKDDQGNDFPDWKEKRLGDAFSWVNTNSLSRERLTYEGGAVQNIHYGDIHTKFSANFHQGSEDVPFVKDAKPSDFKDEQFCKIGDVIIADASEDYADIGKAIEVVEVTQTPLVSGLHTFIARPASSELAVGFSGYLLRSADMRKKIMRIAQGISVLGVSKRNLEKLTLALPHPDEQRKIADFLSAIDTKIDLVAQELEQAKAFKKGLLQQMFV